MKESVVRKLEHLVERFEEVQALLGDPGVIGDQDKFRNLSKEFSQLEDVVAGFNAYQQAQENLASAQEMLNEDDAEMREMAQEEMKDAKAEIERLETELQVLLLPKDPNDDNNCFLEIRAGAGGEAGQGCEAGALWAALSPGRWDAARLPRHSAPVVGQHEDDDLL